MTDQLKVTEPKAKNVEQTKNNLFVKIWKNSQIKLFVVCFYLLFVPWFWFCFLSHLSLLWSWWHEDQIDWFIIIMFVFSAAPFFQCLSVPVPIKDTHNHDKEIQIIVEIILFIFVFAAHLTVPSPREGSVSPQSQKRSMSGTPSGRKTQIHTSFLTYTNTKPGRRTQIHKYQFSWIEVQIEL